jgi:hypothetical protein
MSDKYAGLRAGKDFRCPGRLSGSVEIPASPKEEEVDVATIFGYCRRLRKMSD